MQTQHYLPADVYDRLIERLEDLKPSVSDRTKLDHFEIVQALGEIAGVWPETIRESEALLPSH